MKFYSAKLPHGRKRVPGVLALLLSLLAFLGTGCGSKPWDKQSHPFFRAAFEFADAIPDQKDAAYYHEKILQAAMDADDLPLTTQFAQRLGDWRRGVVYADLAGEYFSFGDRKNALIWMEKAQKERELAEEWQRARIASHMAGAWAKAGDLEKIKEIGTAIEPGEDKWLAFVAYLEGQVQSEGLDAALKLAEENFNTGKTFDQRFAQPVALIRIIAGTKRSLTDVQRERVFNLCLQVMEKAPPSHAHAIYEELILTCHQSGWKDHVGRLADIIRAKFIPEDAWGKPLAWMAYKVHQSRFEAMAGRKEEALKILKDIEPYIDESSGLGFERCAFMGLMIQAHMLSDDEAGARRIYEKGLTTAYREANPRPRAMAYSELLLGAGQSSLIMTPSDRQRLQQDLARPWTVLLPDGDKK